MRRNLLIVLLTLTATFSISTANANDTHPGIQISREMTNTVIEYANANENLSTGEFIAGLQETLDPYLSFGFMAQEAVHDENWIAATQEQRESLTKAFGYVVSNTFYAAYVREFLSRSPENRLTADQTGFSLAKESGPVTHLDVDIPGFGDGNFEFVVGNFGEQGGGWRLINFGGQGVRLIDTYKPGFRTTIARNGMDALIKKLQNKKSEIDE